MDSYYCYRGLCSIREGEEEEGDGGKGRVGTAEGSKGGKLSSVVGTADSLTQG